MRPIAHPPHWVELLGQASRPAARRARRHRRRRAGLAARKQFVCVSGVLPGFGRGAKLVSVCGGRRMLRRTW
jgi:hypothetical protein